MTMPPVPDDPKTAWHAQRISNMTIQQPDEGWPSATTLFVTDASSADEVELRVLPWINHSYKDDLRRATTTTWHQAGPPWAEPSSRSASSWPPWRISRAHSPARTSSTLSVPCRNHNRHSRTFRHAHRAVAGWPRPLVRPPPKEQITMGASMLTATIAFPAESAEPPNFDRGRQLLEAITDASLFAFDEPEAELEVLLPDLNGESDLVDESGEVLIEYARRAGLVIISNLEEALDSRETRYLTVADYRLYISGGLANGDAPTNATQAIWDAYKLPESVLLAMGFIPDYGQPLAHAYSRGASTPLTDTDVVNAIALGLGTSPDWPGGDSLKWIAEAIGKVRDEPGNAEPAEYLKRWSEQYGFDPLSSRFLSAYIVDGIDTAGEEESED
ncbi:hypothetical protein ACFWNK_19860 [Streptomyces sp. NPDC058417]|uniref:hypothetical protein n=1 Tax=unclassified Streptomyces TaxID=2593676 RepID=UPI003667E361